MEPVPPKEGVQIEHINHRRYTEHIKNQSQTIKGTYAYRRISQYQDRKRIQGDGASLHRMDEQTESCKIRLQ